MVCRDWDWRVCSRYCLPTTGSRSDGRVCFGRAPRADEAVVSEVRSAGAFPAVQDTGLQAIQVPDDGFPPLAVQVCF